MLPSWTVALALCLGALANAQRFGIGPDPCNPMPCGPNTVCTVNFAGIAFCRCKPGYFPDPTTIVGCKRDPCAENPCGTNALCESNGRAAGCKCVTGYTGDPFTGCSRTSTSGRVTSGTRDRVSVRPGSYYSGSGGNNYNSGYNSNNLGSSRNTDGCSNLDCGSNAECITRANRPVCACRSGYEGNPYNGCKRSECTDNAACPSDKVCHNSRCINPCSTSCGANAECKVRNHVIVCSCPRDSTGDPFVRCIPSNIDREGVVAEGSNDLCIPTPCGANTNCRSERNRAVCSCKENYIGNAVKGCRLECERDSECELGKGCVNNRCVDPCLNGCGTYANCRVSNHRAVCSCPENFLGNGYNGCYPECINHENCTSTRACFNLKCVNPCDGACGTGAECEAINHKATCKCPKGYIGHPFDVCRPLGPEDLCNPNPCGEKADCKPGKDSENNDRPVCLCPEGYLGDPLVSCRRGDCVNHSECNSNQACYGYKCANPCNDENGFSVCGTRAECDARNHRAICSCPEGYIGDALTECRRGGRNRL